MMSVFASKATSKTGSFQIASWLRGRAGEASQYTASPGNGTALQSLQEGALCIAYEAWRELSCSFKGVVVLGNLERGTRQVQRE